MQFVFPIGRRLLVWLQDGEGASAFDKELKKLNPDLRAEPVVPSLHDIALRELAVGEASGR